MSGELRLGEWVGVDKKGPSEKSEGIIIMEINMGEQITIRLKFVFDNKDQTKALKLHKLLAEYGAVSNIVHNDTDTSLNKDDRLKAILGVMNVNGAYTTGALWKRYAPLSKTGKKTFQRDLNTLIIEGKIEGIKTRIKGSTTMWSRK